MIPAGQPMGFATYDDLAAVIRAGLIAEAPAVATPWPPPHRLTRRQRRERRLAARHTYPDPKARERQAPQ